ncbi:MAG: hypothetical protein IPN89_04590 [Saprospiraceae bacterium]|nr:hypothetical protein [Saprospiraceae bacterium]
MFVRCNDAAGTCPTAATPVVTSPAICASCGCPTATVVANGTGSVCSGGGTATLATWQTSVAAANATGLVYSSVTPVAAQHFQMVLLPSGTIPQDVPSVNQTEVRMFIAM